MSLVTKLVTDTMDVWTLKWLDHAVGAYKGRTIKQFLEAKNEGQRPTESNKMSY